MFKKDGYTLRPPVSEDAEAYYRNFDPLDGETARLTGSKTEFSREEVVTFFHKCLDELRSLKPPALQADSLPLSHWGSPILMLCEITQLCPALCNPMESSLPGSSVYGIFQAKILEQVSIYFSRRSSQPRD